MNFKSDADQKLCCPILIIEMLLSNVEGTDFYLQYASMPLGRAVNSFLYILAVHKIFIIRADWFTGIV